MSNNSDITSTTSSINRVGVGYGVAIVVGILMLASTIVLASYVVKIYARIQGDHVVSGNISVLVSGRTTDDPNLGEWSIGGLDQKILDTYPQIIYSDKQPLPHPAETSCSICLSEYKDFEALRMLPECRHVFHSPCIDTWLYLHASCPMCRSPSLPTSKSTLVSTLR